MRDFGNGWSGLKEYAVQAGVATVDDGDDAVAAKIRAVIQGTLPEEAQETEEGGGLLDTVKSAVGLNPE